MQSLGELTTTVSLSWYQFFLGKKNKIIDYFNTMDLTDYYFQWFYLFLFFNEFYWIFCSFILFSLIVLLFELFLLLFHLFGLIFRVMSRCIINILIVLTWVEQPLPSIKTSESTLRTIAWEIIVYSRVL